MSGRTSAYLVIQTSLPIYRQRVVQDRGASRQALKLEPTSEAKIKTEHLKLQTRMKVVTKDVRMKKGLVREGSEDGTG